MSEHIECQEWTRFSSLINCFIPQYKSLHFFNILRWVSTVSEHSEWTLWVPRVNKGQFLFFHSAINPYIFYSILKWVNTMSEHSEWTQWVNILSEHIKCQQCTRANHFCFYVLSPIHFFWISHSILWWVNTMCEHGEWTQCVHTLSDHIECQEWTRVSLSINYFIIQIQILTFPIPYWGQWTQWVNTMSEHNECTQWVPKVSKCQTLHFS